ncbi:hypothetical protein HYV57_00785 [Candidatus Peregrinibacteria bacterium]|nr:hypothetical protein [Candidatus Peregrinibacteria bacterium]
MKGYGGSGTPGEDGTAGGEDGNPQQEAEVSSMTPRDWDAEYAALAAGEKSPENFTPAQLFDMGRHMVLKGKWDERYAIYDYIFNHPEASEDDKVRVRILWADKKRRVGGKEKAPGVLQELEVLQPISPIARAEWLEARKQCHNLTGNGQEVLRLGRETLELCNSPEIPLYKRIFYLAGHISDVLTFEANVSESTLEDMKKYYELLNDETLRADTVAYSSPAEEYSHLRGMLAEKMGDLETAKEGYMGKFEISLDPGIKAVGALLYLSVVWGENPKDRSQTTMEMVEYLCKHDAEILPAWRAAYEEKNRLVQSILTTMSE